MGGRDFGRGRRQRRAGSRLGRERGIPVIVNMHDVDLARRFADRIVGMSGGAVVFDGAPADLDDSVLSRIYGGASWMN